MLSDTQGGESLRTRWGRKSLAQGQPHPQHPAQCLHLLLSALARSLCPQSTQQSFKGPEPAHDGKAGSKVKGRAQNSHQYSLPHSCDTPWSLRQPAQMAASKSPHCRAGPGKASAGQTMHLTLQNILNRAGTVCSRTWAGGKHPASWCAESSQGTHQH